MSFQRDQFGFIENIVNEYDSQRDFEPYRRELFSWENSKFCTTCSEKGHLWNECKHKSYGMIAKDVVKEIENKNGTKSYKIDETTYKQHFNQDENWSKPDNKYFLTHSFSYLEKSSQQ